MAALTEARIAVGLVAAGALLAACAQAHPAPESGRTPSSSPPSSTPILAAKSPSDAARPSHRQVALAVRTLRQYLHAWASEGPARASRYLEPNERFSKDYGAPRISAGTVRSYRLDSWNGPTTFTLLVSMNLTFTTDPLTWNRGSNDRFVTARKAGPHQGYLLEIASGP